MDVPKPTATQALTGNMEDMDAAWVWMTANLSVLKASKPALYEHALRTTPSLPVLLGYRRAYTKAQAEPPH